MHGDLHRRRDPMLWMIPLILSSIGILMITSTTSPQSFASVGTPFSVGIRQLIWLAFALLSMFISYACLPSERLKRLSTPIWLFSLGLVMLTFVPGLGVSVGGARRWVKIAVIQFQPSEVLALAVVFQAAKLAEKHARDPLLCIKSFILLIMISCLPLMLQPDLGSTVLIVMICMGIYVERFGWKVPLVCGLVGLALAALFILFEPYRMRRLVAWSDPWSDPLNTGFQAIQGLIASANGGIWGTGLGHGFQKLNYLPAAYTDFIYVAFGEEFGLIGTLGILMLCTIWVLRSRLLYNRVAEGFSTCAVWGIVLTVILPFFINIAGVTKLIPLTGMPLPFLSYGGSALVVVWSRIGILMRMQNESAEIEA